MPVFRIWGELSKTYPYNYVPKLKTLKNKTASIRLWIYTMFSPKISNSTNNPLLCWKKKIPLLKRNMLKVKRTISLLRKKIFTQSPSLITAKLYYCSDNHQVLKSSLNQRFNPIRWMWWWVQSPLPVCFENCFCAWSDNLILTYLRGEHLVSISSGNI